ncbi:MAG: hypothetical protein Q7J03_00650 [Methanoregula sp.]|nr:hypothetical protein [Methanoregula sp.]
MYHITRHLGSGYCQCYDHRTNNKPYNAHERDIGYTLQAQNKKYKSQDKENYGRID